MIDLAEALGAQLVVSLGALLADVAHTRPISVTGIASDRSLVERLDLLSSSYEGPTGIVGVLQAQCGKAGLPAASLWAAVPHYIASAPNPKAALALVRKLEGLVGVTVDATELEQATSTTSARSTSPSRATQTCRRSSSASSAPPTRRRSRSTPATCPPATASPASSSASCASAAQS